VFGGKKKLYAEGAQTEGLVVAGAPPKEGSGYWYTVRVSSSTARRPRSAGHSPSGGFCLRLARSTLLAPPYRVTPALAVDATGRVLARVHFPLRVIGRRCPAADPRNHGSGTDIPGDRRP
jgi:hypothetical protein